MTTMNKVNPFEIDIQTKNDNEDDWDDWDDDDIMQDMDELGNVLLVRSDENEAPTSTPSAAAPSTTTYGLVLLVVVALVLGIYSRTSQSTTTISLQDTTLDTNSSSSSSNNVNTEKGPWHIILLGERHSGLTWLKAKMRHCFPQLVFATTLSRAGTFFQEDPHTSTPKVIIPIFLNVYDWVNAMKEAPIYAPNHKHLDWYSFTTRPWSIYNTTTSMRNDDEYNDTTKDCQHGFQLHQIQPCQARNDGAAYELDTDGHVFSDIIHFRAAKIHQWCHGIATYQGVEHVIPVQYESVLVDFEKVLKQVQQITGQDWNCSMSDSDKDVENALAPVFGNHSEMELKYIDWLTTHVNWQVERLVGYEPWNTSIPDNSSDVDTDKEENANSMDITDNEADGKDVADDEKISREDNATNTDDMTSISNEPGNTIDTPTGSVTDAKDVHSKSSDEIAGMSDNDRASTPTAKKSPHKTPKKTKEPIVAASADENRDETMAPKGVPVMTPNGTKAPKAIVSPEGDNDDMLTSQETQHKTPSQTSAPKKSATTPRDDSNKNASSDDDHASTSTATKSPHKTPRKTKEPMVVAPADDSRDGTSAPKAVPVMTPRATKAPKAIVTPEGDNDDTLTPKEAQHKTPRDENNKNASSDDDHASTSTAPKSPHKTPRKTKEPMVVAPADDNRDETSAPKAAP